MTDSTKWKVVKLNGEGTWQILATNLTYKQADDLIDEYTDKYPHAMVDMLQIPPPNNLTP